MLSEQQRVYYPLLQPLTVLVLLLWQLLRMSYFGSFYIVERKLSFKDFGGQTPKSEIFQDYCYTCFEWHYRRELLPDVIVLLGQAAL